MPACETQEDVDADCGDDLDSTNAKSACEEMLRVKKELDVELELASKKMDETESVQNINPLSSTVNAFGDAMEAEATTENTVLTRIATNLSTQTTLDLSSSCNSQTIQEQMNMIEGPDSECVKALSAAGIVGEELKEFLRIKNVTQKNVADAESDCKLTQILSALSEMDASIDNLALQKSLNEAKGAGATSDSDQFMCTDISVNQSACKYVRQSLCCSNDINQKQSNVLQTGCASVENVEQANEASARASCEISASATISETMKTAVKNSVTQDAITKSTGVTLDFLGMFMLLLFAIPFLLFYAAFKFFKKGLKTGVTLLFMGSGVIFIGLGSYFIYVHTTDSSQQPPPDEDEITILDKPFSVCDGTTMSAAFSRATFKAAKDHVAATSGVIGFDFFPDDISKLPSSTGDTELGLVGYITNINYTEGDENPTEIKDRKYFLFIDPDYTPRNVAKECDPRVDTNQERCVSYLKPHKFTKNNQYLYAGIGFIVVGVLLSIAIFIYYKKNKKRKGSGKKVPDNSGSGAGAS